MIKINDIINELKHFELNSYGKDYWNFVTPDGSIGIFISTRPNSNLVQIEKVALSNHTFFDDEEKTCDIIYDEMYTKKQAAELMNYIKLVRL